MTHSCLLFSILALLITNSSCNKNNETSSSAQRQEDQPRIKIPSTAHLLNQTKKCFLSSVSDWACHYKIGNDLEFTIWGIGEADATTVIDKTVGEDGEYQIRFVANSPCIRVMPGGKIRLEFSLYPFQEIAFVSPIRE